MCISVSPEALIGLVVIAVGCFGLVVWAPVMPGQAGRVLGFASSITPTQVIELTNHQRRQAGLSELTVSQRLSSAALAKGQHMFGNQYWAHTAPDGTQPWFFFRQADYDYLVAGENLARDFADSSSMVSAWMASPTHKANILNPKYKEIGIAVIDGTLEGYETTVVVQFFATPQSVAAKPSVPAAIQVSEESPLTTPEPAPVTVTVEETSPVVTPDQLPESSANRRPSQVLASRLVPQGSITVPPLLTPLQLLKAFFLAMIMTICFTLFYDSVVIGHRSAIRLVGKNLAHLILLSLVAFLVIFFKGGVVG